MEEKKEILEKIEDTDLDESLLSHEEIDDTEGIEEHYAKMYKDLPPDVVKMLISTHPLYGEKGEPTKEKIKEPVKEPTKEIVKESENKFVPEKKTKAKKIEKVEKEEDYEYETEYEEEEEEDDEREFLYSLFSKKDGEETGKGSKKYVWIGILTTVFFVCIIGMTVNITQNAKNKSTIEALEKEKIKLTRELENNQVTKDVFESENTNLKKEVESLKAQLASGDTKTEVETPIVNGAEETSKIEETTTANIPKKENTYTVQKGDGLWKISTKMYGSGKYVDDIAKANNLQSNSTLTPGTVLVLPEIKGGQ